MIEEIRRFILVAKNGNVSKTAEEVFITQSALSQSIKRLEKGIGVKLFVQKGKSLHLTTEGAAVAEIGTKIIELWEKAKKQNIKNLIKPTFAIGLFDNAALLLGKYFIKNSKNESFNLELTIDTSKKLLSKLELGIIDVAIFVIDKNYQFSKNTILIETFTEELIPVASSNFKNKIQEMPFILYNKNSNTRSQIDEKFIQQGMLPNVIVESTSTPFMKELAMLGGGVAILPENNVQAEIRQGSLKKQKLPFKLQREYGIFINKSGQLYKDHPVIKDLIKNLS